MLGNLHNSVYEDMGDNYICFDPFDFYRYRGFFPPEQYEAFLKFNHDQLHRRFGNSEMSCKYSALTILTTVANIFFKRCTCITYVSQFLFIFM